MVLSLSLTVVSCSNDDDDQVNNSIVGTWKFKEVTAGEVKTNSTVNDEKVKTNIVTTVTSSRSGFVYVFREDKTVTLTDTKYTDDISEGTYTLEDGVLTLTWGVDDGDTYSVSLKDDILVMEDDYVGYYNSLKETGLSEIGIEDENFEATKAIAKISFSRQQ